MLDLRSRVSTLARWGGLLLLPACADEPAPASAYQGEPLAVLSEGCDPATLEGADQQPCVFIERFAAGEGPEAKAGDWVRFHYIALVAEAGAEARALDDSHGDKPLSFKLGESSDVIDGMHLGITGMQVGERRRLRVPPRLGYRGRKITGIPPEAELVFLVEVMGIRPVE